MPLFPSWPGSWGRGLLKKVGAQYRPCPTLARNMLFGFPDLRRYSGKRRNQGYFFFLEIAACRLPRIEPGPVYLAPPHRNHQVPHARPEGLPAANPSHVPGLAAEKVTALRMGWHDVPQ